jgi:tetratricopeptide (TPR) repeat protein
VYFLFCMRYIGYWFCLFCLVLVGCKDTSREEYDIPKIQKKSSEEVLNIVLEKLSENIKSNPSNPSNYYKRALWKYNSAKYDLALIDISQAERLNPNSGEILYLKSAILHKSGKNNALENALLAQDQGFESSDLYSLIAQLYIEKKNGVEARNYLKLAEEIYPYNADVFNGKGKLFALQKDTNSSIANFKKAIQLKPGTFEYYDDLIKLYGKARLVDSALILNDRAIKKFPEMKELLYNKAYILENYGLADSSIRIYRQFIKLAPERYDVYDRIGGIYLRNRNYSAAYAIYNRWAEAEPENVTPKLKAARTYITQFNLPAAKYYLQKSLEKHPENKILLNELAAVNYRMERMSNYSASSNHNSEGETSNREEVQDTRIFDRSIDINKIPKRTTTTIGRDSTRN